MKARYPAKQRVVNAITSESKKRCFENPDISLFSVDSMGNYNLELLSQSPLDVARLYWWNVHQMKHVGQEIRVNGHPVDLTN